MDLRPQCFYLSSDKSRRHGNFEGLDFASEEEQTKFDTAVKKFQDSCLREV